MSLFGSILEKLGMTAASSPAAQAPPTHAPAPPTHASPAPAAHHAAVPAVEAPKMWLHKAVMRKLADNYGNIPPELLD